MCSVDGCSRPARSRELCERHYKRQWRYGSPEEPLKPLCSVLACERRATVKGWCQRHYMRNKRHGNPEGK